MMKTLAIVQQKGGVGKTTSTANIAAELAQQGKRVLAVDCDPQGSLTLALGQDPNEVEHTLGEALMGNEAPPLLDTQVKNLWLCPANRGLADAEFQLAPRVGRERFLAKALARVSDKFDVALLDTPPSLGLLTINCLAAASDLLIPVTPSILSAAGMRDLLSTIGEIQSAINPALHIGGIFITFADARSVAGRRTENELREDLGATVLSTTISRRIAHEYATQAGIPIVNNEPKSPAALEYKALVKEILSHVQL